MFNKIYGKKFLIYRKEWGSPDLETTTETSKHYLAYMKNNDHCA